MERAFPKFRAAAVQAAPIYLDKERTIVRVCELIEEAASKGAELIVFPEVFVPGYPYWIWLYNPWEGAPLLKRLVKNSVLIPSKDTDAICKAAKEAGSYVVVGVNERDPNTIGTTYNTNIIIDKKGKILGKHRKLVPTWAEKLIWGFGDGSSLRVYDTEIGKLGTLACGENTNTLARFALLAQGEQVHAANYPAFPFTKNYDMVRAIELRSAAHSFEGKLYNIVATSVLSHDIIETVCSTEESREMMSGRPNSVSLICGPDGQLLCEPLVDEEGIVYAEIDIERIIEHKRMHDIVGNYNRFDVFRLILDRREKAPIDVIEEGQDVEERLGVGRVLTQHGGSDRPIL